MKKKEPFDQVAINKDVKLWAVREKEKAGKSDNDKCQQR